ncbi:PqiC family protein [Pseudomaricurvus sp.]|uniref:PqiC family protein n=1 Tax=Pseudomaricurvus sp. TaxID=2004510 RepID=UPI003F6B994E
MTTTSLLRASLLTLSCLILSACLGGTPPPATQYYLLRADSPGASHHDPAIKVYSQKLSSVQLNAVNIAPYLHQNGLVMKTDNHRIAIARYNKWSEPLTSSIPRFLSRSISHFYGAEIITTANTASTPTTTVEVNIDQLHGQHNGDVTLEASWTLKSTSSTNPTIQSFAFSDVISLNSSGYDALVAAEKQLLEHLSREIAQSLPPLR